MSRQEVTDLMKGSKSLRDWARNESRVVEAFAGRYPAFWHEDIIRSGLRDYIFSVLLNLN